MKINKTVDECLADIGNSLFQKIISQNESYNLQKAETIWVTDFLNYQDEVLNDNGQLMLLSYQKLINSLPENKYQIALMEFKNANIEVPRLFAEQSKLTSVMDWIDQNVSLYLFVATNTFSNIFIETFKQYQKQIINYQIIVTKSFEEQLQKIFFLIFWNLTYLFRKELDQFVTDFFKILFTEVDIINIKKKQTLWSIIYQNNNCYFSNLDKASFFNFIDKLKEIADNHETNAFSLKAFLFQPTKKIAVSFNTLLKKHQTNVYHEIWNSDTDAINFDNVYALMNLFSYESYFSHGHNYSYDFADIYQKSGILPNKYFKLFKEYQKANNITK